MIAESEVNKTAVYVVLVITVIAATIGCSEKSKSEDAAGIETKRDPVIVLDDWWNVDYIKNGCQLLAQQRDPTLLCPANLDFDGRHENQNGSDWSLVDSSRHVFNGQIRSTQSLAQDVCKIVKGVGGSTD